MLEDEEDDDNHLCIKCNATIIGLDNYITHRKETCAKNKYRVEENGSNKHVNVTSIEPIDQSYNMGADVFFESLQLQSSNKKHPANTLPIHLGNKNLGIVNKNASNALCLPHSSKQSELISPFEEASRGEDWIGGHNLRVTGNDDNETKLIKAIANISGIAKKIVTPYHIIDEYRHHDDDSNDDSEDSDELDGDDHHHDVKWKPPSSHTGGKWRPIMHWPATSPATPELHEEWDIHEEHTDTNWNPISSHNDVIKIEKSNEMEDDEEDANIPPPSHTKGKWIPGAGKSNQRVHIMDTSSVVKKGIVQYWCGPCNRRLGSKAIYTKHLMSNLHLKKILPENDLEYAGELKTPDSVNRLGKRTSKPNKYLKDYIYFSKPRHETSGATKEEPQVASIKKKRISKFTRCLACKSRVKSALMGKHLISHYHFRKTNFKKDLHIKLILDNIEAIVQQYPFQCSPCKFYANHLSNFMDHWCTVSHSDTVNNIDGNYWCAYCKFECVDSLEIYNHLTGSNHLEVVATINRSMPIIIRKKRVVSCASCNVVFRYNVQLKQHSKLSGHPLSGTASDEYQCFEKCLECGVSLKSARILAQHIKKDHNHDYVCSTCNLSFESSEKAKEHRRSQEHKDLLNEKLFARGHSSKDPTRSCPHCKDERIFKNVLELKRHLREKHPDMKYKCSKCGMEFLLSQGVSRHIRGNACKFDLSQQRCEFLWNCRQCPFQTDSQAECFFHEVLHTDPIKLTILKNGLQSSAWKYKCPICSRMFRKASLRCHIRQHTYERPFSCDLCDATFARKNNLITHLGTVHQDTKHSEEDPNLSDLTDGVLSAKSTVRRATRMAFRTQVFSCPHPGCHYTTRKAYDLRLHATTVHSGHRDYACTHCDYSAKTNKELNRHLKSHDKWRQRLYECVHCEFKTDQSNDMKRHDRLHRGEKPYKCPHCQYRCNNLENLRKHAIYSGIHPEKKLYMCDDCDELAAFESNYAKEFKSHLLTEHPTMYDGKSALKKTTYFCFY